MPQIVSPPIYGADETLGAMKKLLNDSRVVRSAHFIAAQRKDRKSKMIGVVVVVLNILIGSGLIEAAFTGRPTAITITIKLLAFFAAALAGIQAFFNFQKEVECHRKSGNVYSRITHKIETVIAEYQHPGGPVGDFKALSEEFVKANDDATVCIPTDSDLNKARAQVQARDKGRSTLTANN